MRTDRNYSVDEIGHSAGASTEPPLPDGWQREVSKTRQKVYYHNYRTGRSQWTRPVADKSPAPSEYEWLKEARQQPATTQSRQEHQTSDEDARSFVSATAGNNHESTRSHGSFPPILLSSRSLEASTEFHNHLGHRSKDRQGRNTAYIETNKTVPSNTISKGLADGRRPSVKIIKYDSTTGTFLEHDPLQWRQVQATQREASGQSETTHTRTKKERDEESYDPVKIFDGKPRVGNFSIGVAQFSSHELLRRVAIACSTYLCHFRCRGCSFTSFEECPFVS